MNLVRENNQSYLWFDTKAGILLFWPFWFFIAVLTILIDFLNAARLTNIIHFHSGNYNALKTAIDIYTSPRYVLNSFFIVAILAQFDLSSAFYICCFIFFSAVMYSTNCF